MPHKALTYLVLGDKTKAPGDKVTDKELKDAGQEEEDIDKLYADGALGDEDEDLHPDHQPVDAPMVAGSTSVVADDSGEGGEE